jgi:hypothetical protein
LPSFATSSGQVRLPKGVSFALFVVIKSSSEPSPDLIRGPNSLAEQKMVNPSQLGFLVAAEGCAVLSASSAPLRRTLMKILPDLFTIAIYPFT